jgi:ribonucleotide reductase alpha subunit
LPKWWKKIYKTAWEIPSRHLVDMAADRQAFVDQSQSFNLFVEDVTVEKLNRIHFYGWKKKLKTGSYYVRTRSHVSAQNFAMAPEEEQQCAACSA